MCTALQCTVLQRKQCDHVIAIIKTLKKHEKLIHCLTVLLMHATYTSALFQSTADQTGMCLNALHPPTYLQLMSDLVALSMSD